MELCCALASHSGYATDYIAEFFLIINLFLTSFFSLSLLIFELVGNSVGGYRPTPSPFAIALWLPRKHLNLETSRIVFHGFVWQSFHRSLRFSYPVMY